MERKLSEMEEELKVIIFYCFGGIIYIYIYINIYYLGYIISKNRLSSMWQCVRIFSAYT